MFLIEYGKGHFINADIITSVHIDKKGVRFYVVNDYESEFNVEEGYENTFCNNLQAINQNITNIESELRGIRNGN